MTKRLEALVVGAGPVGLAMAAELRRYGVAIRLIDSAPAPSERSKALVIWSRTLELMDRMGCADAFLAAGLRLRGTRLSVDGRELVHLDLSSIDSPHPYALSLAQSETERLLSAHLFQLGGAVERGVKLLGFQQSETGVSARLCRADGAEETVECDWLIGCDGAHSTVRHLLQIPFSGTSEPGDFLLADVRIEGGQFSPDEIALFWHRDGLLGFFPFPAGRVRIIADLGPPPGTTPRPEPTLADVQTLIDERGPKAVRAVDPVWLANFRVNERIVAEYRKGRVFLAGDAAHIHSPAGGQGMNTGIQDACNLAWKLALVSRGIGLNGPLLDSYSAERRAVGEMVLKNATRLTHVALLRNPLGQAIRNNLVALLGELEPVQQRIAAMLGELNIAYHASPLTRIVPGANSGRGVPRPGDRAPLNSDFAARIGAGGEPKFVLLGGAAASVAYTELMRRFSHLLTPIDTVAADLARRYGGTARGAWLIRPDGYIALAAPEDGAPAVESYLSEITR